MKKIILTLSAMFLFLVNTEYVKSNPNGSALTKDEKELISNFLIEMNDAGMMYYKEGMLAKERGTTESLRQYGQLLIDDQALLKRRIEALATSKGVTLPITLSTVKNYAYDYLQKLQGEKFDKKFKMMIKKDHKRDIRKLKKASKFNDTDISMFASQNLPLVKGHLTKLKNID